MGLFLLVVMKKSFLIVLSLLSTTFSIKCQSIFDYSLNQFLNDESVENSSISIQLINGFSREVLMEYNSEKLLIPASIQKLFTTTYALNQLGESYKFKTIAYSNGFFDVGNQKLIGDLIIHFSGDPTLESRYFDSLSFLTQLNSNLNKLKIKSIEGQLILYPEKNDFSVNRNWLWGDIGNYYASGYSTHSFRDNYVDVNFDSPNELGRPTKINEFSPFSKNFNIKNKVISSSTKIDLSYAFGAPFQKERNMIGELPSNRKNYNVKISMHNPKDFLRHSLLQSLENNGVRIKGSKNLTSSKRDTILIYESPPLENIIKIINYKSNNNFSENILIHSTLKTDSLITYQKSPELMQEYWKEILNISDIFFSDGCGLSRLNLISSNAINKLLLYNLNELKPNSRKVFISSLPVAGLSGTLKSLGKGTNISGNFIGKSGSMKGIRCYSGYFIKNEIYFPFSIMVNNFICESSLIKKLIENLMVDIYEKL